jgi:hypothetical protein
VVGARSSRLPFVSIRAQSLRTRGDRLKLSGMRFTSEEKLEAEHQFREFLRDYDLPQPDEVEYGVTCLRFYYDEPQTCVVFDLDPDAEDEPEV